MCGCSKSGQGRRRVQCPLLSRSERETCALLSRSLVNGPQEGGSAGHLVRFCRLTLRASEAKLGQSSEAHTEMDEDHVGCLVEGGELSVEFTRCGCEALHQCSTEKVQLGGSETPNPLPSIVSLPPA